MGVHVDEAGKDHPAAQVERLSGILRQVAVFDGEIHDGEIRVGADEAARNGGVLKGDVATRDVSGTSDHSRFRALSCHFLSIRWLKVDVMAKMTTPMTEMRIRAA